MPTRHPIVLRMDDSAPQVVDLSAGDALSPRGRRLAWVFTLVIVLTGLAVLSAVAGPQLTGSTPASGGTAAGDTEGSGTTDGTLAVLADPVGEVRDGAIQAEWDGPVTHLDWQGRTYATAAASFVGDRVASPGDRVQRTLLIGNAGPSDAVMTVALITQSSGPDGAEDLGRSVDLFWDTAGVAGQERFATLVGAGGQGQVVSEVAVAHGATVPVTVGFTMPAEVTAHQGTDDTGVLEFQVVIRLQGDTAAAPPLPGLAITGAQVAALIALALVLAGLGWLLWLLARRRRPRCEDCGARLSGDDPCGECAAAGDGARAGNMPQT